MNKRRMLLAGGLSLFLRNLFGQRRGPNAATGPVPFGYKMAWLAVKTAKSADPASFLNVQEQRSVTWAQGIDAVYDRTELARATLVFVTPPIKGWTLVAGWWAFPGDRHSLESLMGIVRDLSATFGEVQGFASHRVIEYHHWILARNGHVERSFAYIGERGEVWANTGLVTEAERKLAFSNQPSGEWRPNENDVMTVASGWSLDPTKLTAESGPADLGIIGRPSQKN